MSTTIFDLSAHVCGRPRREHTEQKNVLSLQHSGLNHRQKVQMFLNYFDIFWNILINFFFLDNFTRGQIICEYQFPCL
jgi:hypothetical protein